MSIARPGQARSWRTRLRATFPADTQPGGAADSQPNDEIRRRTLGVPGQESMNSRVVLRGSPVVVSIPCFLSRQGCRTKLMDDPVVKQKSFTMWPRLPLVKKGRRPKFGSQAECKHAVSHPQGSDERFQSCGLHLIPLSQACLAQLHRPCGTAVMEGWPAACLGSNRPARTSSAPRKTSPKLQLMSNGALTPETALVKWDVPPSWYQCRESSGPDTISGPRV